jgi:hypothetical protein
MVLFAVTSRPDLWPIRPFLYSISRDVFPVVKRPEHEAYHTLSPNAEVKVGWDFTSILLISHHGVVLRHRDKFTLTCFTLRRYLI